ncbi:MAG: T9SS C-terminal target domain-containing protein [Calditrichaeota bacterium]|nr:MAG: T9SS C-terminal target domain-containing protein [Calditrichota bacterium]MBL1206689.1 T9SS C-terminal target domain-containing protein [Calditrichota bacterium]NOG46516.1 T9SS type A sorting domain-containing protein [Calditrichota bacterium]
MSNPKFNRFKIYCFLILILSGFIASPLFAEMTAEQKELQEKVKAYLGVDNLTRGQSGGFIYQFALRDIYDQLSRDLQKAADNYLLATVPTRQMQIQSPKGKFILHYDTTDVHSVPLEDISQNGIPDFIDSAAVFFDYSWEIEIDQLGFEAPKDILGNEVQTYTIVFSSLSSFDYGYTLTEQIVNSASGTFYTSFIEMDNDFQNSGLATKGFDGMRVTAAHEFNHAIQLGYPVWENVNPFAQRYFLEMLSTWLEEVLYPDVNDYYAYLPGLFRSVQSLRFTSQSNMYGNGIYFHMLAEQYNPQVTIEILETIGEESVVALNAMDIVLKKKGSSFSESLNDYGKWMYFTGSRSVADQFFNDAADFPEIEISESAQYNGSTIVEFETKVNSESFYYISVDSILQTGGLASISTNSDNPDIRLNHFNSENMNSFSVSSGVNQPLVLDFIPQDIAFLVSNSRDTSVTANFTFIPDSTIKPPDGSKVVFGPNPAKVEIGVSYFYAVPANAKISIFDLNQHPVQTLKNESSEKITLPWDLRDKNDKPLSSGIYYFVVVSDDKKQVGKIAVVR